MKRPSDIISGLIEQNRTGLVSNLGGALAELVWTSRHTSDGKLLATYKITGQIKSGKNNMQTSRSGKHYPLPAWASWRDEVLWEIKQQGPIKTIEDACSIHIDYAGGDLKRRDVPGMADALFHCLERAGVIKDDSLFRECHWWYSLDRENPRALIRIYALGGEFYPQADVP